MDSKEMYDATTVKYIKKNDGKVYIVYGTDDHHVEFEAVKIIIAHDEHDPRQVHFVGFSGFQINIPDGVETYVPMFIYEVLKQGNLSTRTSRVSD